MFYVYVLVSLKTGRFYIGYTSNLQRRLLEHNTNNTKSLRNKGHYKIVYFEELTSSIDARKREKIIKAYKGGNAFKRLIGLIK